MNRTIEEVYVWHLPVRIYHWINAICIVILFITGLYIAWPVFQSSVGEAVWYQNFGWIRWAHFATAYVFIFNFLIRLYWALFGGDRYGRFGGFQPWNPKWWGKPFKEQMAAYLFMSRYEPNYTGHNPVAALTYFIFVFLGSVFMIVTGLAMYGENNPGGFFDTTFGWVVSIFGSAHALHSWHHLVAWGFVFYFIVHIYAVARHDVVDRTSVISSIITGYKHRVQELESAD